MTESDELARLQDWYASNCDGDWEHSSGIKVESLDNPGWLIRLDILGTWAEGRVLDRVIVETSEDDWLHYWSDGVSMHAASSPQRLRDALRAVLDQLSAWQLRG